MATRWCGSMLPASEARAPFGIRIATGGMCSKESGIESSRTFTATSVRCGLSAERQDISLPHPARDHELAWDTVAAAVPISFD